MVLEWSDFSFLLIGSFDEKESENHKCSKLVKYCPINQFWHEESIGNGFRMIRLLFLAHRFPWLINSENRKCSKLVKNNPINQFRHAKSIGNCFRMIRLLFLAHRFPWWKRLRKSKMFQIGQKSSYKPIWTWEIDWKWFQNDPTFLSWSSAPLMKKSPKIENVPNWSKIIL